MTHITKRKYRYGNKGIVFTLDAMIALIIVILILNVANRYLYRFEESSPSKLQIIKAGSDSIKMISLGYNSTFLDYYSSSDPSNLTITTKNILSQNAYGINYNMTINLSIDDNLDGISDRTISTPGPIPSDRFVGSGDMIMSINNPTNPNAKVKIAIVRYWIWQK